MAKGSVRNERKVNQPRAEQARLQEQELRAALKRQRSFPVGQQDEEWKVQLQKLEGMLKKAIARQRRSETHSRKSKGGKG